MFQKDYQMYTARIMAQNGHSQKFIAQQLGVTDRTVRNYLNPEYGVTPRKERISILAPYYPIIDQKLDENPYYNLVTLNERLQNAGYQGGMTILRDYARKIRKDLVTKAVLRFESEPGRQAQVDWKECGKWIIDGVEQKLYAFVMLLGYSRKPFVLFTLDMTLPTLLTAHVMAFDYFGAVPHEILYDNMKTAWLNKGGVWCVNPKLLEFASFCGFEPKRCRVRRPQTKGKVERFIGYLAHNFLSREAVLKAATLADLNRAVSEWLIDIDEKQVGTFRKTRKERFNHEKQYMNPWRLTAAPDTRLHKEVLVSREGLFSFNGSKYSVNSSYIGYLITLKVDTVRRKAEASSGGVLLRTFTVQPKSISVIDIREEDRASLLTRWEKENRREKVTSEKAVSYDSIDSLYQTEVVTRDPAEYDRLLGVSA